MNTPQAGIYNETSEQFYYLEFQIFDDNGLKPALKKALTLKHPQIDIVVSFGKQAWSNLSTNLPHNAVPTSLQDFHTLVGVDGHTAIGTQSDIFFWVHGKNLGDLFDQMMHIHDAVKNHATLSFEQHGFDYHHSMDLIGFEDGTANPKTDALKRDASVVPEGEPGAGGCLVMCQKWVHNLDAWHQVPVSCQEKIVGRTKDTNEELEGDAMPDDSHVSRTDLKFDGVAMKIYRRSTPFGGIKENGLMFLAFGCDLKRFTTQLDSMYGLADGKIDQLINFSSAVTGGYWFAPSQEDLAAVINET